MTARPAPCGGSPVARRPVRPRAAASLVIVDRRHGTARVLMGRRRAQSSFMPGWYVFPGGRVERADALAAAGLALAPRTAAALARRTRHGMAYALAALRETFEETGLVIAAPAPAAAAPSPAGAFWGACAAADRRPDVAALAYIARAITPASSAKRYDTRFFLVGAERAHGRLIGNGELVDLRWVPLDARGDLPIADVTAFVLDRAAEALARGPATPERIPRLSYRGPRCRVHFE